MKHEHGRRWSMALLTAAVAAVLAFYAVGLPSQLRGNDLINNLGTGYHIDPAGAFPQAYYHEALKLCRDGDVYCTSYQRNFISNLTFNYPVPAILGRFVQPVADFFAETRFWAGAAALTGICCAIVLFFIVLRQAAVPLIALAGGLSFFAALRYVALPPPGAGLTNPYGRALLGAIDPTLLLPALLIVAIWRFERAAWMEALRRRAAAISGASWLALLLCLAGVAAAIIGLSGAKAVNTASEILAIAGFTVAMMGLLARSDLPWWQCGLLVSLAVALVNDQIFWIAWYPVPRGQLFLLCTGLLPVVLARPQSRWAWMVLVLPLFHVSVAVLIATALFGAEAVMGLIRRRPTKLLFASGFLLAAGEIYRAVSFAGVFSASPAKVFSIPLLMLADPATLWGLVNIGLLFAGALTLAYAGRGRLDTAARVALLAMILTAAGLAAKILQRHGAVLIEPGLEAVMLAPLYLAPSLCTAGLIALLADMARFAGGERRENSRGVTLAGATGLAGAALLLIVFLHPPADRTAWLGDFAIAMGRVPADPAMTALSGTDDIYPLRISDSQNDPLHYLALLKYKVRAARGLLDQNTARIEIIDRDGARTLTPLRP